MGQKSDLLQVGIAAEESDKETCRQLARWDQSHDGREKVIGVMVGVQRKTERQRENLGTEEESNGRVTGG